MMTRLKTLWRYLSPARHPNVWFWGVAALLNALLFLPFYLTQPADRSLLPWPPTHYDWRAWLVSRDQADLLRFHAEWVLGLALWAWLAPRMRPRGRRWLAGVISLGFGLALLYQIYAAVMLNLYHYTPNFYNDYPFIVGGVHFLLDSLNFSWVTYALGGLAFLATLASIVLLLRVLFHAIPVEALGRATRGALLALALAVGGYGMVYGVGLADPYMEVNSLTAEIVANIRAARQSRHDVAGLASFNPYETYDYTRYRLQSHPNVYLIFVESYGSILYTRPFYQETYRTLMTGWQAKLEAAGWHTATTLSISPMWGGGSWMAYTSAMFGLRITEQQQFLALREKYQYLPYPNLGRYLHSQGYDYTWVVPITRKLPENITEMNRRFYGADRWITFKDLHYTGPMYGWGPSPPDQYTLGFIRDEVVPQEQKPLFLFFLTQSSHYPWAPLPPVVDDWRALNQLQISGGSLSKEEMAQLSFTAIRQNYLNAIVYSMDMLGDFLLHLPDDDAIVILIGDHQPPTVSARRDGYATPIHILSRDAAFVADFAQYGFRPGLWLDDPQPTMHHEGLYSMLVRQLVAHYGVDRTDLPPYLPEGIAIAPSPAADEGP